MRRLFQKVIRVLQMEEGNLTQAWCGFSTRLTPWWVHSERWLRNPACWMSYPCPMPLVSPSLCLRVLTFGQTKKKVRDALYNSKEFKRVATDTFELVSQGPSQEMEVPCNHCGGTLVAEGSGRYPGTADQCCSLHQSAAGSNRVWFCKRSPKSPGE